MEFSIDKLQGQNKILLEVKKIESPCTNYTVNGFMFTTSTFTQNILSLLNGES
jgi:hypothetical protein